MRVLVTGASGFMGAALGQSLERHGHEVIPLRRGPAGGWDVDAGRIDRELFRDFVPQSLLDAGFVSHHPTVGAGLVAAVGNRLQPAA